MDTDGLIVVDKPAGLTSHDVVARIRRLARTRRVGHGGTLDPMATGVLVIGVNRATRLLTYLLASRKSYTATIRLGQSTLTDDADGEIVQAVSAAGLDDAAIRAGLAAQRGEIDQVPSAVSAIKVDGRRAYRRVREGETVELPARRITVFGLDVRDVRRDAEMVDVDIDVTCSSGTYVRAIARDLGTALGVGGHLTALRRTAVGTVTVDTAVTLEQLEERAPDVVTLCLDEAVRRAFTQRTASEEESRVLRHGGPLSPVGIDGPYGVFAPSGRVLAIVTERDGRARPDIVLDPA